MKKYIPAISLRVKAFLALGCYIFGVLSMTIVSRNDILTARNKLEILELAYKLDTSILEIRRYEKNFLLFGTEKALLANQNQVELALIMIDKIGTQVKNYKVYPMLIELGNKLRNYQARMNMLIEQHHSGNNTAIQILAESIRMDGQEMNELTGEVVNFEHKQIRIILEELVNQLALWSLLAILIGIIIPLFMFFRIYKPLIIIKKATEDIGRGQFSKIEVINTRDEIQQVIEAFNTMVKELQRRQEQLVQSQKLVSIGTLSAGIAHQLNNPLNNISTSCQIAISDFDTGDRDFIKQMLNNIEQETARARDVVHGLLEFSREKEFALQIDNLENIVNRAVRLVRSQIPSSVRININIPSNLELPIDSQRLQEVFLNLIINASQAIKDNGTIDISASATEEHDAVVISFHDDGCGIPSEIIDRLFDPFFTTKDDGQGTGLGLSISYGIIQKHNGNISVQSTPGEGTTFLIRLPLQSEDLKVRAHIP